jgi:excisionase family DNA binding protein
MRRANSTVNGTHKHPGTPSSEQSNAALALSVPPELVEAIAARVAELVTDRTTAAPTPGSESRGRLALSKAEAAEALGISVDHLERHVLPELRVVRSGRLRLVPVAELEQWVAENAGRALEGLR